MIVKRLFCFTVALTAGLFPVLGQNRGNQEMSVEESYLQQSVELMIIREQSRAESRDMKLIALEYIGDAINRGNRGEEVKSALEYLGMEGVMNITRENGRVVNNYPDIRTKAATYLGEMGTPAAKTALLKMCRTDNEPMVVTEVVKSLAKIGSNDSDETVKTINWVFSRYDVLNPDNILAVSVLEAYEKLAEANGGIRDPEVFQIVQRIAGGPYIDKVKKRALQTLDTLYGYTGGQRQGN
jgi:HEAT repeat protein